MKTLAVDIQDGYVHNFMEYVKSHSENITIRADKELECDPFFLNRQQSLHQLREQIKSGDMEMLSQDQYEKEMIQFFTQLKNK